MATRQLRRLKEQLQAQEQSADAPESAESVSEDEELPGKAPFNPFDLLSDEEDAAPQDSQDHSEEEPTTSESASMPTATAAPTTSSSSKKKSKKKPKKGKAAASPLEDPTTITSNSPTTNKDEDIDAILKELNLTAATTTSSSSSGRAAAVAASPLLGVDTKKLRGDEELRRIFGAGVIEAVERQEAAESSAGAGPQGARRRGAMPRNMPRRRPLRKSMLVNPREDWPWMDTGLGMVVAGTTADGASLFKYTWSPSYRGAQALFEQAQASYDPNAIAAVLQQAPFHLDSLMAMYDLYRSMGEAQYAEEVLNRALYALEMAWHPAFDPSRGHCRLDIEEPENRPLFLALFRHAQALSRRGCHSSALEVSKLLLACDPEDPMGALMQLDYLALRAGQYNFLQRLLAEYDGGHAIPLLPNYAYAAAMATFKQEQQQGSPEGAGGEPSSSSSSSSSMSTGSSSKQQRSSGGRSKSGAAAGAAGEEVRAAAGDGGVEEEKGSHELLVQALLLHPLVLAQLQGRLQGLGVGKEPGWQKLLNRKLYAQASDHGSSSLSHLVSIFVERSHTLWRTQDVQAWLKAAAEVAADMAEDKSRTLGGVSAADWATVARDAFPADDANQYNHLRLSDFTDAVNMLPREEMQAAMAAGDMADVQDAMDEQVMALLEQTRAARAAGRQEISEEELRAANPLLMLLRSLLPWVDAGQVPNYEADDQQQGGSQ